MKLDIRKLTCGDYMVTIDGIFTAISDDQIKAIERAIAHRDACGEGLGGFIRMHKVTKATVQELQADWYPILPGEEV